MALNMMLLCKSWFLLILVFVPFCHCQISPSQNIETFYPNETSTKQPIEPPPPPKPQSSPNSSSSKSSSSNGKIAKAVAATAACTIVFCVIMFFIVKRCLRARKRKEVNNTASASDVVVVPKGNVFERIDGNVRGLIVDEDGLDVIYWRKLEGKNSNKELHKEVLNSPKNKEDEDDHHGENHVKKSKSIQEIPLLRGKSSTSHISEKDEPYRFATIPSPASASASASNPPPIPSPSTPSSSTSPAIAKVNNTPSVAPSPPPPPPVAPPPPLVKKSSSKLPLGPIEMSAISQGQQRNSSGKGIAESSNEQVKIKPLHWDKVNTNADHSMVWDKVDRGSFRVDQDLMVALFGSVAVNRLSPKRKSHSTSPSKDTSAPSTKIFLLDPRKSQNIAIVLKSLGASRSEIIDAVIDGKGLNAAFLEKLARVSPTEEEKSLILEYKGDPTRLAVAESFLYQILKAVPSAFKRLNAMLFRLNYDSEFMEIKESLQTIELGCNELFNKGLFLKLLEAVLKAGNQMNAGTVRGNAQAFNLDSLRKLIDVKSNNGKTTLLHFVVEEVVRSEGKRAVVNRNISLSHSSSSRSSRNSNMSGNNKKNYTLDEQKEREYTMLGLLDEQKEREYTMLGLSIVGGISSEFSNVKKGASIDYNSLVGSISGLATQLVEIRALVSRCGNGERGYFVKEMEHFLGNAEEELKLVRGKQTSVLQILSKTTEYYQGGGASNETREDNLQLFVIVKDFLKMVDLACNEIARDMQKKNSKGNSGS